MREVSPPALATWAREDNSNAVERKAFLDNMMGLLGSVLRQNSNLLRLKDIEVSEYQRALGFRQRQGR